MLNQRELHTRVLKTARTIIRLDLIIANNNNKEKEKEKQLNRLKEYFKLKKLKKK